MTILIAFSMLSIYRIGTVAQEEAEIKIVNPNRNTWYRITRSIDEDGSIDSIEPLVVELEATGSPSGGLYEWKVSAVDTRFDELSLVNITWLSPEEISLTWYIPPWPCWEPYPWCCPCSFPWPLPCPFPDWPEPWFFSWSMLSITCEYIHPLYQPVTDSVNIVVEYGLAGESSIETLIYGEDIVGIGQDTDVAILTSDASDKYTKWANLPSIVPCCCWICAAWEAGTLIGEELSATYPADAPPINSYMDLNQSETYTEPWIIIERTVLDILPLNETDDYHRAVLNATEKMIDVDEALEAMRVTYYRKRWAEKVGDEDAVRLQQQMFIEFFVEYVSRSVDHQNALGTIIDELEKTGDIYISPENITDFQAKLWTEGFPQFELDVFDLFGINPWYIENERRISCLYSPEKLSGNLSSITADFIEEIREVDQKLIERLLRIPLRCDLNGDGRVNILDISIAAMAFGTEPRHPRWNPIPDLNNDDVVNILDIAAVALHFGMSV